MPFVKTPANVIETSLDYAGLGAVKALNKGIRSVYHKNPEHLEGAITDMVRTGVGLTGAFVLASMIKPEDYIGGYPTTTSERKLLELKQASANSVKIGDKWVSLDYFGPFGAAMVGIMNARKYGDTPGQKVTAYGVGVARQLTRIPGVSEVLGYEKLKNPNWDIIEEVDELFDALQKGFVARGVPAILKDVAKGTDKQRQISWEKPVTSLQESIPIWRTGLPEKINVLGEPLKGQGLVSQLLAGARIKTASKNEIVQEFDRLDKKGARPALSDITRNKRFNQLKEQKGDENYQAAIKYFGQEYSEQVSEMLKNDYYKELTVDEKKAELDAIRRNLIEQTLEEYGYEKPEKQKLDKY